MAEAVKNDEGQIIPRLEALGVAARAKSTGAGLQCEVRKVLDPRPRRARGSAMSEDEDAKPFAATIPAR